MLSGDFLPMLFLDPGHEFIINLFRLNRVGAVDNQSLPIHIQHDTCLAHGIGVPSVAFEFLILVGTHLQPKGTETHRSRSGRILLSVLNLLNIGIIDRQVPPITRVNGERCLAVLHPDIAREEQEPAYQKDNAYDDRPDSLIAA